MKYTHTQAHVHLHIHCIRLCTQLYTVQCLILKFKSIPIATIYVWKFSFIESKETQMEREEEEEDKKLNLIESMITVLRVRTRLAF